ncbi:MAG: type I restriction enzyme HsdR N-terminal domain-containing protein [Candidatus Cardinium sp.]|uniref:type I restriction enzyme HsdR N-terminal domain-containing protein n=1 Tax=Cardinium endosymbiont of Dermatophagoides farinae TaxID=2597823 RepID=UPI00118304D9|nr:type I restriction enzyme HsdR N-terminal domain-containing protein [Cardinium endosymbiont of Dermatophagoides farinae]TSJ81412.1 type I restriction enzyme HsdR N-terminal domain-containing protein [Cardinium endosymbiont of Dermatophagoides farinae]UWW97474.1 MAG: type I restriction enzyme HsdR N-terminal domain-containing protein [Candidatus Cardinium sp.]
MMPLALPSFDYKTKQTLDKTYILDLVRKKYVLLTPEEWVRQHMLHYLIHYLSYPKGLCRLEKRIYGAARYYRPDIILCDKFGVAKMVVECKAPHIPLTNETLGQMMQYNRQLAVDYLVVTNGINHFCWEWEKSSGQFQAINHIPTYQACVSLYSSNGVN